MKSIIIVVFAAIIGFTVAKYNVTESYAACFECTELIGQMEFKLSHPFGLRQLEEANDYYLMKNEINNPFVDKACNLLPPTLADKCKSIVAGLKWETTYKIIKMFFHKEYPADICVEVGFCNVEWTKKCVLWPEWPNVNFPPAPPADPLREDMGNTSPDTELLYNKGNGMKQQSSEKNGFTMHNDFYHLLKDIFKVEGNPCGKDVKGCDMKRWLDHLPVADFDEDNFASGKSALASTFRGTDWSGVDCDDKNSDIYPGSGTAGTNATIDHNCNGITGTDPKTGMTYEDKFCKDTPPRGFVIIGDSGTAHFHLPPRVLNAYGLGPRTYNHLHWKVANELDVPQCSWGTGHTKAKLCPPAALHVKSIYERMRERNLCMHNDFVNMGVNGADMTDTYHLYQKINRKSTDRPLTVIVSMMGNDICNQYLSQITPQSVYRANMIKSLQDMDAKLPKGSIILFIAPVDGRVLYESSHDQIHPLGVNYKHLYGYLECMQFNPCNTWLTSDEQRKESAWNAALGLRKTGVETVEEMNPILKNIKAHYLDFPLIGNSIKGFYKDFPNGNQFDIIEPADGFHESQLGNKYFADVVWEQIEKLAPEAMGEINPHNDDIHALFADAQANL